MTPNVTMEEQENGVIMKMLVSLIRLYAEMLARVVILLINTFYPYA